MRSVIKIDHINVVELESLCAIGKLNWEKGDASLTLSFKGLECELIPELLNLIEKSSFTKNDVMKFPCFYARWKNFSKKEEFRKAIRQLFAVVIASIPED